MPTDKTFSSSALARRSRAARVEQQKSLPLTAVTAFSVRDKSSQLCRHNEELLRRSRKLRDQLRNIYNAH